MDHLPLPMTPHYCWPEVPYLCTEDYPDGVFFTDYPQHQGVEGLINVWGQREYWSTPERMSFLQNWLYFGPMNTITKGDIKPSDLIRQCADGTNVLDTSKLPYMLHRFRLFIEDFPEDGRQILERVLNKFLDQWYYCYAAVNVPFELSAQLVLFSIGLLHEAFYSAWLDAHRKTSMDNLRRPHFYRGWHPLELPWFGLHDNGWCPREAMAMSMETPSQRYYASLIERPSPHLDHSGCDTLRCTANLFDKSTYTTKHVNPGCKCSHLTVNQRQVADALKSGTFPVVRLVQTANDFDLEVVPYKPEIKYLAFSHVWADGLGNPTANSLPSCQLIRLQQAVARVNETRFLVDSGSRDTIDALSRLHQEWKDAGSDSTITGLRERHAATVTRLRERHAATLNIYHPVPIRDIKPEYFWIDTLCCPAQSGELKSGAISRMRNTYMCADKVLVLDSYLEAFPPPAEKDLLPHTTTVEPSALERCVRLRYSNWVRRLWTLQEGALAKQVWIQFADKPVELETLFVELFQDDFLKQPADDIFGPQAAVVLRMTVAYQNKANVRFAPVPSDLHDLIYKIRCTRKGEPFQRLQRLVFEDAEDDYNARFRRVIQELSFRSTSLVEDEAICLATLLGLDVDAILRAPREERMKKFWDLQPSYTSNLLAFSGPKLTQPGYRWAPSSFLNTTTQIADSLLECNDQIKVTKTNQGLLLNCSGIIGSQDLSSLLYDKICLEDTTSGEAYDVHVNRQLGDIIIPDDCLTAEGTYRVGILYLSSSLQLGAASRQNLVAVDGLVVYIKNTIDEVIIARTGPYVDLTTAIRSTVPFDSIPEVLKIWPTIRRDAVAGNGKINGRQCIIQGGSVPLCQKWCLT